MEVVSFAKEVLQEAAEHAASYRLGQTLLRYMDRALWVVEKSARWAVPPPLDQDDRPQPELIRPLNWVLFLTLLIVLRVTRESISLVNLALGKPPLRSADVVSYIQSKRRYLRTLKYSGCRALRSRPAPGHTSHSSPSSLSSTSPSSSSSSSSSWPAALRRALCFTQRDAALTNGDEVMIVKRSKRSRAEAAPAPSHSSMERLIEKMMVDLDDSDESSSCTLTNISARSDRSEYTESDQDVLNRAADLQKPDSPNTKNYATSTPEKIYQNSLQIESPTEISTDHYRIKSELNSSCREATVNFIQNEINHEVIVQKTKTKQKIANGRTLNNYSTKERTANETWYTNMEQ